MEKMEPEATLKEPLLIVKGRYIRHTGIHF